MKKYSGILFIGDPHITEAVPQRRKEEEFLSVTIDKLKQSIEIAEKNNFLPIITGDLVNKPREENVIVPLINLLRGKRIKLVLGNHDVNVKKIFKKNKNDSDGINFNEPDMTIPVDNYTTVKILEASGCIEIVNFIQMMDVELENNVLVRVLMVPYGVKIPEKFPEYTGEHEGEIINLMMTHHDINFGIGKQYPGCEKIFPIENCDLVVNGHIHDYKPVQEVGGTKWFNPGNIIRTSKANMLNTPAVYSISNTDLDIERHVLNHKQLEEVFDAKDSILDSEINEDTLKDFNSQFVEAMGSMDVEKSDDGSGVEEMIDDYIIEKNIPIEISDKIRELLYSVSRK